MTAKFHAIGTFTIDTRNLFVIYGDIVDGVVKAGMFLNVPLNSAVTIDDPIHSVEFVDRSDGSHVALAFKLDDPNDAAVWKGLNIADELLEITDRKDGDE